MASEKKPSIYSDRSTIGSSNELDEYGVWVKSEPQDLSSPPGAGGDSTASLPDLSAGFDDTMFDSTLETMDLPDLDIPGDTADLTSETQADDEMFAGFDSETNDPDEAAMDLDSGFQIDDPIEELPSDADDSLGADSGFDDFSIPDSSPVTGDVPDIAAVESDSDTVYEAEGFTELSVDDFLDEPPSELAEVPASPAQSRPDLSTELLMKIAEELSSIKNELSSMKQEFAGIKASSAEDKDAQHGGFFTEEEDEKIALTGDELDNILNTADFTEEAGEDATEDLEGEFSFPEAEDDASSDPFQLVEEISIDPLSPGAADGLDETLSDGEDIIVEEENDSANYNFDNIEIEASDDLIQGIELESAGETLDTAELAVEDLSEISSVDNLDDVWDSEELQQLRDEGVEPMTAAPEDTSYLEDEIPAEDLADDDLHIDISPEENFAESIELDGDSFEAAPTGGVLPPDETLPEYDAIPEFSIDLEEAETPEEPEEALGEIAEENELDEISLDLSDAVIDEPDLSAEISENPVEEPSLDTLEDISDGLSLNMDDFESAQEAEDDSLEVIPEGFVTDADDPESELEEELAAEETEELAALEENPPVDDLSLSMDDLDAQAPAENGIPTGIKDELKTVLSYMDQLLESLPEDKIEEFARSEYFDTYKKLFKELGLV